MQIIRNISALKKVIRRAKAKGETVGFVPTMGALHEGHLSLMRQSRKDNDLMVVSIFVNPMQFGPKEDYKKYPRTLAEDVRRMKTVGVDIVFVPDVGQIYPEGFQSCVNIGDLADTLCGRSRPGHFKGVLTVVNKLFNIVEPDVAYFGQKDYQQALIIGQMVHDLDMNLRIKVMPIVREKDGLAMSSRNAYLSPNERSRAAGLNRALNEAKRLIRGGETSAARITGAMKRIINWYGKSKIDYIAVVEPETLSDIKTIKTRQKVLVALAVFIGRTRLIDNILV
ncbi:MAG: pantoate--beta-alanine ligase [Candidatus Brocadiia bacterium]